MVAVSEGINSFLGAGFFFITAGAAEGCIKSEFIKRLLKSLRLHDVRIDGRAMTKGRDRLIDPRLIGVNDNIQIMFGDHFVPKLNHLFKLPRRINMQDRKRKL